MHKFPMSFKKDQETGFMNDKLGNKKSPDLNGQEIFSVRIQQ